MPLVVRWLGQAGFCTFPPSQCFPAKQVKSENTVLAFRCVCGSRLHAEKAPKGRLPLRLGTLDDAPSPAPSNSPTANTVCGPGFLGNASASFSAANCTTCATTMPAKAIDNDADTAAEANFAGGGGVVTLKAVTRPGTVVAAGRLAGALVQFPAGAVTLASLDVSTYLDDQKQESGGGFMNAQGDSTTTSTLNYYRFRTTKPYNRIDLTIERRGV